MRQGSKGELPAYATFKGVRSLKHKYDKNHQEGMRKSSSLHDLSSQDKGMAASLAASRFLSCSGDGLDVLVAAGGASGAGLGGGGLGRARRGKSPPGGFSSNPYFTIPRTSWPSRVHPSGPLLTAPAAHPSLFNSSSSLSSTSSTNSASASHRRGSFDERPSASGTPPGRKGSPGAGGAGRERPRHSRERSTSLKDFPTHHPLTLPREAPSAGGGGGAGGGGEQRSGPVVAGASAAAAAAPLRPEPSDDLSQSMSADETDSNETDELKVGLVGLYPSPPPPPSPPTPPLLQGQSFVLLLAVALF